MGAKFNKMGAAAATERTLVLLLLNLTLGAHAFQQLPSLSRPHQLHRRTAPLSHRCFPLASSAATGGDDGATTTTPTNAIAAGPDTVVVVPRTSDVVAWLKSDSAKKVLTWVGFAALVVGLRSFTPVVIGTFLLSLVGTQSVDAAMRGWSWVQKKLIPRLGLRRLPGALGRLEEALITLTKPPRQAFVAAYIVSVMTFIATISVALVPRVIKEGQYVVARISQSSDPYLYVAQSLHGVLGEDLLGKLETFITAVSSGSGVGMSSISDQIFSGAGAGGGGVMSLRDLNRAQAAVARGEWSPERATRLAAG